jgi:hypothetical protein
VIKIYGALTTSTYAAVSLINGTQAKNVYWLINGAVSINDYTDFKGTIVAHNGAINLKTGAKLDGRAFTTVGAISTTAVTANSPSAANTMPLTLLSFSGKVQTNNGVLNWRTANEQNTASFEVEQSIDGKSFDAVGKVNANNPSAGNKDYTYTTRNINILAPVVYYRLKMNDVDGKFTYSNTVVLQTKGNVSVSFYPNPVKESAILRMSVEKRDVINYSIIDNAGKVLRSNSVALTEGSNNISIDVKNLANGLYFISIKGEQTNKRVQFVKQ